MKLSFFTFNAHYKFKLLTLLSNLARLAVLVAAVFTFTGFTAAAQSPVANFTASPVSGCSPLVVSFKDASSGNPTSWLWDFGNGNTSAIQNPSSSYFTPGRYTVTLTAKNANGVNTLSRTQLIQVYETPVISFSASRTSGCFPLKVQFTDNSTAGSGNTSAAWFWDFGDGGVSTEQHPLHVYTSAGSFTITLKVTNDKGCYRVLTTPNYIQTLQGLSSAFTNTQPAVCQPPASVTFTNGSSGPGTLSYQWNFGDGNLSTDINPFHTYTIKGLYDVTLIVNSTAGCTDTLIKRNLIPVGAFNPKFSGPDTVCINLPANFKDTSQPAPSSVVWDFGDGSSSTDPNPVKTYPIAGTYIVKMLANYGTCIDSVSKNIVVVPRPVADFSSPNASRCQPPLAVNFQNLSANSVSWQWNFGDGSSSTDQNPVHNYPDYGSYDVSLVAVSASGCIDSIKKTAFVKIAKPQVSVTGLPASGCIPFTINPVANVVSVDPVTSYAWNFGDGNTSSSPTPSNLYPAPGNYTVRLIITTATGCADTVLLLNGVRVGTKPAANFSAAPLPVCAADDIQFTNLSSTADAWIWDFGDGTTSNAKNPLHKYLDTGSFTVTLNTFNNGCPDPAAKPNYVVVRPPIAAFGITPECVNRLRVIFNDRSIGPVTSWFWDFGDGVTSTNQNQVHDYAALGDYNVTLTATTVFGPGDECVYSITRTAHVINEDPDITAANNPGCKGSPVGFNAVVSKFSNIATYDWDFGDGQTASVATPGTNHIYANPGNYTVRLITTDINGCKDTAIKVNFQRINGPTANFSATNFSGCKGLTTTFNNLSTTDGVNAIRNWKFDFGDGIIQNFAAAPFQHAFDSVGTYPVKLTVTDAAGCSDSLTLADLVTTSDPFPDFYTTDTASCPGATVTLNSSSVATNYTTIWSYGDGSSSASPTHIYTNPGVYAVKIRITDQFGCSDSLIKTEYIEIDRPVARFTVSDSISSCTPFQVDFKDSSTYFNTLLWNFGDGGGPSGLTTPTHYYGDPGMFKVSLVATSPGGCTDTAFKTIAVYDTAGSFVRYNPLSGCSPRSVAFTAFTPGPVTYLWDFGDGNTDTTTIPSNDHVFTSFGDYVPRVIMQDPSGCLVPVLGVDTIHITGSKTKFGADQTLICDSGLVVFTDSTTFNDPITNWNWSFGDGAGSVEQSPVHYYASEGLYTVSLNTVTAGGCNETLTRDRYIKVVRSPLIGIIGDSVACRFASLTEQAIFFRSDTSAVSWLWNFPNGNSSTLQNPLTQAYDSAGHFVVTAIATNSSGCRDTATKNIFVNPLPSIDMPGTITLLSGESIKIPATFSPNVETWQWNPQTSLSCSNCAQPVASPRFSTSYNVLVIDSNGCRNVQTINIVIVCKDGNIFIPNTFSPNGDGSNDRFFPRGKGIDRIQLLRIFNRWGEVVFEQKNFAVNDAAAGWDGSYKGKTPLAGVYIYQVEVYCSNGELIKFSGNISLLL